MGKLVSLVLTGGERQGEGPMKEGEGGTGGGQRATTAARTTVGKAAVTAGLAAGHCPGRGQRTEDLLPAWLEEP